MAQRAVGPGRGERGFALLVVLWSAVLLGLLAGGVTRLSRSDLVLVRNLNDAAQAELAAEAGIWQAVQALAQDGPDRPAADGAVRASAHGGAEIRLAITDEYGRIDINHATRDSFERLLRTAGLELGAAAGLADAIVAERARRRGAAEAGGDAPPDRAAAPADPGAPAARRFALAFAAAEDLLYLPGIDEALRRRLEPALTVHTGRGEPDLARAPAILRAAFAGTPAAAGRTRAGAADTPPASGLLRIHAEARTPGGARAAREALVEAVGRGPDRRFGIRLWRQARSRLFRDAAAPDP